MDDATFTRMREHWSDDGIVETAEVISLFSFINRWNDSLATTLEFKLQIGWTPSSGLTGGQAPRLERLNRNGHHARCPVFPKTKQPFRLSGWLMCCQRGGRFTRASTGLRLLNIFFTPNPIKRPQRASCTSRSSSKHHLRKRIFC